MSAGDDGRGADDDAAYYQGGDPYLETAADGLQLFVAQRAARFVHHLVRLAQTPRLRVRRNHDMPVIRRVLMNDGLDFMRNRLSVDFGKRGLRIFMQPLGEAVILAAFVGDYRRRDLRRYAQFRGLL